MTLMLLAALWMFLLIIKIWFKEDTGKYAGTHWHLHLFTDYAGFFVMILPPTVGHTSFLNTMSTLSPFLLKTQQQ